MGHLIARVLPMAHFQEYSNYFFVEIVVDHPQSLDQTTNDL